jgi:hypothetical protein
MCVCIHTTTRVSVGLIPCLNSCHSIKFMLIIPPLIYQILLWAPWLSTNLFTEGKPWSTWWHLTFRII